MNRSKGEALEIKPGGVVENLRLIRCTNHQEFRYEQRWLAECLNCGAEFVISYSGLKTRRTKGSTHCRKCNPNGSGVLATHQVGLEIAGVMVLRQRKPRTTKNVDLGKRSWDVQCVSCGAEWARNSNRLRAYEEAGRSCCAKCGDWDEDKKTAAWKRAKEENRILKEEQKKPEYKLSGIPARTEMPLAGVWAVCEMVGL